MVPYTSVVGGQEPAAAPLVKKARLGAGKKSLARRVSHTGPRNKHYTPRGRTMGTTTARLLSPPVAPARRVGSVWPRGWAPGRSPLRGGGAGPPAPCRRRRRATRSGRAATRRWSSGAATPSRSARRSRRRWAAHRRRAGGGRKRSCLEPDISLLALSKVLSVWQGHNSRIRKKRDNASRSLLPETRARVAPGPLLDSNFVKPVQH